MTRGSAVHICAANWGEQCVKLCRGVAVGGVQVEHPSAPPFCQPPHSQSGQIGRCHCAGASRQSVGSGIQRMRPRGRPGSSNVRTGHRQILESARKRVIDNPRHISSGRAGNPCVRQPVWAMRMKRAQRLRTFRRGRHQAQRVPSGFCQTVPYRRFDASAGQQIPPRPAPIPHRQGSSGWSAIRSAFAPCPHFSCHLSVVPRADSRRCVTPVTVPGVRSSALSGRTIAQPVRPFHRQMASLKASGQPQLFRSRRPEVSR